MARHPPTLYQHDKALKEGSADKRPQQPSKIRKTPIPKPKHGEQQSSIHSQLGIWDTTAVRTIRVSPCPFPYPCPHLTCRPVVPTLGMGHQVQTDRNKQRWQAGTWDHVSMRPGKKTRREDRGQSTNNADGGRRWAGRSVHVQLVGGTWRVGFLSLPYLPFRDLAWACLTFTGTPMAFLPWRHGEGGTAFAGSVFSERDRGIMKGEVPRTIGQCSANGLVKLYCLCCA